MKFLGVILVALGCLAASQAAGVSSRETFAELVPQAPSVLQCVYDLGIEVVEGLRSALGLFVILLAIPVINLFVAPIVGVVAVIGYPLASFLDFMVCIEVIPK